MLFRVWDKKNNCWSKEDFLLDKDGDLQEPCDNKMGGVSCCPVLDYKNYEVEFNTGITLADGTETFYGDVVAIKNEYYKGGMEYVILTEESIWNMAENRSRLFEHPRAFRPFVKIEGNIHEAATDAMKIWIGE